MTLTPAGPNACPFVALAEDRDSRSSQPDQAHRCYAEDRPEPRSLAHQRTYCLTREYSVCPIFLDWAGRLAAHRVGPVQHPFAAGMDDTDGVGYEQAPDRYGRGRDAGPADGLWAASVEGIDAGSRASAGVGAGRAAGLAGLGRPEFVRELAAPERAGLGSRGLIAPGEVEEIDERGRLLGRERAAVGPGDEGRSAVSLPLLSQVQRDALGSRARAFGERARIFGDRARNFGGREVAPTWIPRHASEDYPDLRVPRGLPSISPMLLAVIALLVAAAAILIVPGLLGDNGAQPTQAPGGAASSASPSPSGSASAQPTPDSGRLPARNYRVKRGDTLASIARKFGITQRRLLRANPAITDPDQIKVGDRIRIPARPAPTATPTATPAP
jgi:LysM repeat protein